MKCITVRFTFINYFKKIFLRNTNKAIAMFITQRRFPVRTAQSQYPNVYKQNLTRENANRCHSLSTTYLTGFKPFQILFLTASLIIFLQLRSCLIRWYEKEAWSFGLLRIEWGWQETLNLLHVRSCILWCLTWGKTEIVPKLSRVRSTNWKQSLYDKHWTTMF